MVHHIANLKLQCTKLETMGSLYEDLFKVKILILSLQDCEEYNAIISPIHTVREETTTGEYAAAIIAEDYRRLNRAKNVVSKKKNTEREVLATRQRKSKRFYK